MTRKLRVQYPGAIYHVMNRGNHRENIFLDDEDRACFLSTLAEACRKTEWGVLAYCCMPHHFHLVVETPQGNLVAGMKWLLGVYTKRFNIRHKLCGHLFAGRYKALIVEGNGDGSLATVCDYVHRFETGREKADRMIAQELKASGLGRGGTAPEQERGGAKGGLGPPPAKKRQ